VTYAQQSALPYASRFVANRVSEGLLGPSVPSIVGLGRRTPCGFVAGMLDLLELDQIGLTCAGKFASRIDTVNGQWVHTRQCSGVDQ
jgi:hypothetical protein